MGSQGHSPGEWSSRNGEWEENRSQGSGRAVGLLPHLDFAVSVSALFYHGPQQGHAWHRLSWDCSHSGIWMCAGETEDFLCIQDISVFLITLQGVYCKLLLWFHVALWAHQFRACFLQELWNNRMENPVKAHCSGERLWTNLPAFWQCLWRINIVISCSFRLMQGICQYLQRDMLTWEESEVL